MPPLSVMKKRTNLQSFWNGVQELQQVEGLSKTTDTHLMCTDGSIPVHGPLLAANSTVFKNVFLSQENNYFGVRTVILPDFKVEEMFLLVQFMYYGFVNITSLEDAELLKDLLVYFQVNVPSISVDGEARDISTIMYYCDSFGQGSDDDEPPVPELRAGNTSADSKDSFHQSMSSSFAGSEGGSEAGSDSKVTAEQNNFSEKSTSTSKVEQQSKTTANGKGREVELEKIKSLVNSINKSADSKKDTPTPTITTSSESTIVKSKIASTPTSSSSSSDSEKVLPVTQKDEEEMKSLEHDKNRQESVEKELSPERFTQKRPGRRPGPKCKRSIQSRSPSESSVESAKKSRRVSPSGFTANAEGRRTRSSDIETTPNVSNNAQNSDENQDDLQTTRRTSPRRSVRRLDSPNPNSSASNEATDGKNEEQLNKTNGNITKANCSRVASALSGPASVLVENKLERDMPSDLYGKPNELFEIGRECFVCRKLYENPVEASTCITEKHGMVRCYLCFSAVRTTAGLFDHYKRKHQKTSKDNTIICPFPDCEQTVSFSNLSTHCLALHVRKRREFSTGNAGGNQQKKASSSSPAVAVVASKSSPNKAASMETPKPRTSGKGSDKDKESRVPEKPKGLPKKGEFIITKDTGNGKPISYKTKY